MKLCNRTLMGLTGLGVAVISLTLFIFGGIRSQADSLAVDLEITSGADDAWESGRGQRSFATGDLTASSHPQSTHYNFIATGLRFQSVGIPQGATVTNAYLQLFVFGPQSGRDDPNLRIHAEAADDAEDFSTNSQILSRARTASSAMWVAKDIGFGGYKNSPSLAEPLTELFARPGWRPGNDLVLLLIPNNTTQQLLRFWAKEKYLNLPPKLHIEYVTASQPGSPDPPPPGPPPPGPAPLPTTVLDIAVLVGNDDATQKGRKTTNASATDLTVSSYPDSGHYSYMGTGLRFQGVTVASGAVVTTSYLQIYPPGPDGHRDPNLKVYAEATDNGADFVANPQVLNRTRTTASASWVDKEIGYNSYKNSPPLNDLLNEVFSRPGWQAGNALVLLLIPNTDAHKEVRFWAKEKYVNMPAKLHIEYTVPPAPEPPPPGPPPPAPAPPTTTVDIPVLVGNDDATQDGRKNTNAGATDLTVSSYPNSGHDSYMGTGFRFQGVNGPRGAVATTSYLQIYPSGPDGHRDPNLKIYAEPTDNGVVLIQINDSNSPWACSAGAPELAPWNMCPGQVESYVGGGDLSGFVSTSAN